MLENLVWFDQLVGPNAGGNLLSLRFQNFINTLPGGGEYLQLGEGAGDVSYAYNTALDMGRQLALLTYADYVAGAGWSNPSAQLAAHAAAGGTATLSQADLLQPSKTYQLVTVISGRTAGTVTPTGGAAIGVDGTNTQTITATGTALTYTPTTDFDGTIDCATVTLNQTNILASSAYPGPELYVTANAASDPKGNEANATTSWESSGGTTLTSDAAVHAAGSYSLKGVFVGVSACMSFDLNTILTVGKRYRITFNIRHVGTGGVCACSLAVGKTSTTTILVSLDNTNITFQPVVKVFEHSANTRYLTIRENSATDDGGVYLDNISIVEVNPLTALHTGTTWTPVAGPCGPWAPYLDGVNDFVNPYSKTLNSFFNPNEGTLMVVAKVSGPGVWTDGEFRYLAILKYDLSNYILASKTSANNQIRVNYTAGGISLVFNIACTATGLFMITLTWDKVADQAIAYLNDAQQGATQTGLGTWVGNLFNTATVIGAATTAPTLVHSGLACHVSLGRSAATPAQIQQLAIDAGVYGT